MALSRDSKLVATKERNMRKTPKWNWVQIALVVFKTLEFVWQVAAWYAEKG